jgi:response regulator RpfG family c-di-GMP phosphodiesterase
MVRPIKLPTLLVITKNPSIRVWMKKHLDDRFFILNAEEKEEAHSAMQTRLDFIILDSEFEEALELCEKIAKVAKKVGTPILLITGRLKKAYREKAKECGVTDFLSDQLDASELEERIETGLKTAAMRQKTEEIGFHIPHLKQRPKE